VTGWADAMLRALAATMSHPAWWAMSLAAFLIRGGILVVGLAIVSLPSAAAIATALTPLIDRLAFGGLTAADAVLIAVGGSLLLGFAGTAALAGSWLDLALAGEAARDEDLDLAATPRELSSRDALSIRVAAHFPTLFVAAYGVVRLIFATYDELLSPGDATVDIALRIAGRAPDAVIIPVVVWLVGEAIGSIAARRLAAGATSRAALLGAVRLVLRPRGLATLVLTTLVIVLAAAPFLLGVERAWENVRTALLTDDPVLPATLVLMVGSWVLGLAVLGAALTWRATAWTVEAGMARIASAERTNDRLGGVTQA
jgi:hypothetical protein